MIKEVRIGIKIPENFVPEYCAALPVLHTAGVVVLYRGLTGWETLMVQEKRPDPRFLKEFGSSCIPVGRVDVVKDGSIETGGAKETARRELYEETGLQVSLDDLAYLGRFAVPNACREANCPDDHVRYLISEAVSAFGQELVWVKPLGERHCLESSDTIMRVCNQGAVCDVFYCVLSEKPEITPPESAEDIPDTTIWWSGIELLTSSSNTRYPRQEIKCRSQAYNLLKTGQAVGKGGIIFLPWSQVDRRVVRPWVPQVLDTLALEKMIEVPVA